MNTALAGATSSTSTYAIGHRSIRDRHSARRYDQPHGLDRVVLVVGLALVGWARRVRPQLTWEQRRDAFDRERFRRSVIAEHDAAHFGVYPLR